MIAVRVTWRTTSDSGSFDCLAPSKFAAEEMTRDRMIGAVVHAFLVRWIAAANTKAPIIRSRVIVIAAKVDGAMQSNEPLSDAVRHVTRMGIISASPRRSAHRLR